MSNEPEGTLKEYRQISTILHGSPAAPKDWDHASTLATIFQLPHNTIVAFDNLMAAILMISSSNLFPAKSTCGIDYSSACS
jgi:hypothetical protein